MSQEDEDYEKFICTIQQFKNKKKFKKYMKINNDVCLNYDRQGTGTCLRGSRWYNLVVLV